MAAGILIGMPVCAQEEPISDGVFIGDKNVSGMMPDEAAQYVKNEVATLGSTTVTITMGSQQTSATFRELGFSWENTDLVDEISQIGTSGNIIERYKEQKDLQNESAHYEIEYTMDESMEAEFVNSCSQFNSDPVEGSLHMGDDGYPYVEGGTDGLGAEESCRCLCVNLTQYLVLPERRTGTKMIAKVNTKTPTTFFST